LKNKTNKTKSFIQVYSNDKNEQNDKTKQTKTNTIISAYCQSIDRKPWKIKQTE